MNTDFYAFGEILWDCLPSGRHVGGAPFNVSAHLAQLGVSVSLISAVGRDSLGDEILQVARDKNVNVDFVTRVRIGLPTGTVIATLDEKGNATYELVQPAAWDEIRVTAKALDAVSKARALTFGSLAGRSPYNLEQLDRLLAVKGPLKFFDVNLRPPFVDPALVIDLAKRADVDQAQRWRAWQARVVVAKRRADAQHAALARMKSRERARRLRRQQMFLAFASRSRKKVPRFGIAVILLPPRPHKLP